jgi:hypothetical protein
VSVAAARSISSLSTNAAGIVATLLCACAACLCRDAAAADTAHDQVLQQISQEWKAEAEQLATDIQCGKVFTLRRQVLTQLFTP